MPREKRTTYPMTFKKEVVAFMEQGHSPYAAKKHFSERDKKDYDSSIFYQWKKKREDIKITGATKKRVNGAGRKPKLDDMEDILSDEVVNLRLQKFKVTRTFIRERAQQMADEAQIEGFKGSGNWVTSFLKRNGFSLRRTTNLTTLTDDQLIQRAVDYMKYLQVSFFTTFSLYLWKYYFFLTTFMLYVLLLKQSRMQYLNLSKTILMDETAVYFEDARTQTVDLSGW